jgi:hypothetical protein
MSNGLPVEVIGPDGTVIRPGGWEGGLRGRGRLALFGLVVALLLAAAGFGVSRLFTAASGAQSPEATVREFLTAIEQGDLAGAAATLRPIEAETLVQPAMQVVDELQRLGLVDPAADPSADGAGSGLSFAGVELSTDQVSDRVAFVALEGEVAGPPGGLAPGPLLELLPLPDIVRGSSEAITLPPGAGLAVVAEDGQSYVSLWYTVAELSRREAGMGPPGAPVLERRPSTTPEEVGHALLDSVASEDLAAALALLDPVEAAAAYDYSGLYMDVVGASEGPSGDEGLSFDEATVTAEVDGDLARVTLALTGLDVALHLPPGLPGLGDGGLPSEVSVEIVAVERDDGWYLSPGRSATGLALDALAGLESHDIAGLIAALFGFGPPVESGWAEFVPTDDPAALAMREKLPLDLPGVVTLGHFDDAFRRSGDLSVTRVYALQIGFADATIAETEAPDGEPVVERFGEDVIIVGQRGGMQITVSVFGLDDADTEAVATTLYHAIADRV